MSRRRYINTTMATDKRLNQLGVERGDFAVMLYTWMIPHAADDATLNGDIDEFMATVIPMRRDKTADDVVAALTGMVELGLVAWDGETIAFPRDSFYKHQSYIRGHRRAPCNDDPDDAARAPEGAKDDSALLPAAPNSEQQRKTAQSAASFKSSFSFNPLRDEGDTSCPPPSLTLLPDPEKSKARTSKRAKPEYRPLTGEQRAAIIRENRDLKDIELIIAEALDHEAARKRSDMNVYVRNWVQRQRDFRNRPGQTPARAAKVFDPRKDPMYDDGAWLREARNA